MGDSRKHWFLIAIFSIAFTSCSRKEFYPKIEKVEPNIAWTGENTQVEMIGKDFIPTIKIKTQSQKVENIPPILKLGDNIELTQNITYFSRTKISFIVPKGLPPGEYKLTVLLANGKSDHTYFRITRLPKPVPKGLNYPYFSNANESTVIIYGNGFDETSEIILVRDDGKEFVIKDFVSSSTEIRFSLPQGAETGNFYVIIRNSEGIKSDTSDKVVLRILSGPKINVRDSYEIDPLTGKVKIIFEIENSGEVELDEVEIDLSTGQKLKVGKVGKQKIYVEAYADGSTNVSWSLYGKDSISFASVAKQGQINICKKLYYKDEDGDGYGDKNKLSYSCNVPDGYVNNSDDCNDLDPKVNPSTVWYKDNDGDGYTDGSTFVGCTPPQKYFISIHFGDCNDEDKNINPSFPEVCNRIDDNCNNQIDEGVEILFYRDKDGDGYGNISDRISSCIQPTGYVLTSGDCNDNNATINPVSHENCNGIDDDCDGLVDENVATNFYRDSDGDGYGNPSDLISTCSKPSGYVENSYDCDDSNANINPMTVWYKDLDNDFYSDGTTQIQCSRPLGYKISSELVSTFSDCDDNNFFINPNTIWYKDADSDGFYPAGGSAVSCSDPFPENSTYSTLQAGDCNDNNSQLNPNTIWYKDEDNDNFAGGSSISCNNPFFPANATYFNINPSDCNDTNASIYPGAPLNCNNGQDNDCSGNIEKWAYTDSDGDRHAPNSSSSCVDAVSFPGNITVGSHLSTSDCNDSNSSIYPGAPLNCNNSQDNDCSGEVEAWFYQDQDSDTWTTSVSQCANSMPSGFTSVSNPLDCDDNNFFINPNTIWYKDADSDGFYPVGGSAVSCPDPFPENSTYSTLQAGDCNDNNSSINPGASEICNGIDDNCNTNIDEGLGSCYISSCPTSISATSFFASSTGDISIQITWNDPATNESNFVLEKSKSPSFSPSVTYVIPADNTLKTLTFQEPLTQFWFRVWATNPTGSCTPVAITNILTPPGLLWAFSLTGLAQTWDNYPIHPKSFDLNSDNIKEIITADDSGYVYAISTVNQNLEVFANTLWVYYAGSGWRSGNPAVSIYQGSPTVVIPINNPGPGRKIVYINRYGQATLQTNVNIDSFPPVITDINGDSISDIIFSSDNFNRIRAFAGETEIFNINPAGNNFMPALFYFKGSTTNYIFGTDVQKILGYAGIKQLFEFNLPSNPLEFITTGDIDSDGFSEAVILREDDVIDVFKLIKNPLLAYNVTDMIRSKPAFADFNSDGITDVVFTAGNNLYFVYGGSETSSACSLSTSSFSSPAVIPGNPPTIVVGRDFLTLAGEIIRIRADCSISWQQDAGLSQMVRSSPLIFDIDEDGEMEVIIGTTDTTLNSGQVIIINLANGSIEATVSPLEMGRINSSARADDIDNDGIPEIVIGSDKASISGSGGAYIISCGGNGVNCSSPQIKLTATKSGWGKVRTTPLIYDLNNDGYKDIILSSDNSKLFAISGTSVVNGQTYTLWEISLSGVGIGTPFPSSPTVIVKSGTPYIAVGSDNSTLHIVNGATGTLISSFGAGGKIYSSPTTLDYNLDGVPDLVFGSDDNKVYVLSGTDFTTVLFSYQTGNNVRSSAGLVDFDGDGITDFGIGSDDGKIYIFNGRKSLICETAPFSNLVNIKPQVAIYNSKGVFGTTNSRFVMNLTDCSVLYHDASGGVDPYTSFGVFYTDGLTKFVFSRSNEIYVSEENFLRVYPFPFTYSVASGFSSPIIDDIDGDGSLEFAIVSIAGSSKVFAYRITNTEFSIKFGQFAHDRHNTSFADYIPPLNLAPHLKFYDESRFEIQKESGCKSTNLISITLIFTLFYIFKFLKDLICPNKRNTKLRENNQFFIDQKYDKRLK